MARLTLRSNRKFKRLQRLLSLPEPYALGLLEMLWNSAYDNTSEIIGDSVDVEVAAGWPGEPGVLTRALMEAGGESSAGFIEEASPGVYHVHDLWDHAPDFVKKRVVREAEREKMGKSITDLRRQAGSLGGQQTASKRAANGRRLLPTEQQTASKRAAKIVTPQPSPVEEGIPYGIPVDATAPTPAPPPDSRGPRPVDLLGAWNANRGALSEAKGLPPGRAKHAQARLAEVPDLARWTAAIQRLAASKFCRGETDRGDWRATFDFLLRPDTLTKIEEGKYDNRSGNGKPTAPTVDPARNRELAAKAGRIPEPVRFDPDDEPAELFPKGAA